MSSSNMSASCRTALFCLMCMLPPATLAAQSDARPQARDTVTVTVHKNPSCGCCKNWIEHLTHHGFEVAAQDEDDMRAVKAELGVPAQLASCHTATVGGYVIEGHVPADLIEKLLKERPDIAGLAVPGMPIGSPGMEMEGREPTSYNVISFTRDGTTTVYATR